MSADNKNTEQPKCVFPPEFTHLISTNSYLILNLVQLLNSEILTVNEARSVLGIPPLEQQGH